VFNMEGSALKNPDLDVSMSQYGDNDLYLLLKVVKYLAQALVGTEYTL
jgi:hypothetical protein